MEIKRLSRISYMGDLVLCSAWLLLMVNDSASNWTISPFLLLFPALRLWCCCLMHRRSKLMVAPIVMLSLMSVPIFLHLATSCTLFAAPCTELLHSLSSLFNVEFCGSACDHAILFNLTGCIWMIFYPLGIFIYGMCKKQLQPCSMSIWKSIGLCTYIFATAIIISIVFSISYKSTVAITLLALMLMLIPIIFNKGNIRNMFTRSEVAYLLTLAMFAVGYVCGIGLELKSVITVCILPATFFAVVNWYIHRPTSYVDVLLIVAASAIFWCAQYTINMTRILLLLFSLALMAVVVIRLVIDTKRYWSSAGVYVIIAFVMPIFCLGYNPYSVLEARRYWHFDRYFGSPNGLLYVGNDSTRGLRDRYGVILPVQYDRIELLTPSKPYCKVRKNNKWQIYDIERKEFVSKECFNEVIPYDDYTYCLKSENGDKYLIMPRIYNRYDNNRSAVISNEM